MDDLNNLPEVPGQDSDHELQVLQKYFSDSAGPADSGYASPGRPTNWKFIAYTTVLFLAIANPFIDRILCGMPYLGGECGSIVPDTIRLIVKAVIFFVLFFFMQRYLA